MQEINPIDNWHRSIKEPNLSLLYETLDDEFLFYSPVVFRPKEKYMGFIYLIAASRTFLTAENFNYSREIIGENDAMLEFRCEINGIQINGVDTFKWNEEGKFTEMKVLLRPQKSLDLIQQEMEKHLLNPEIWR